jgi:hypothetical protein
VNTPPSTSARRRQTLSRITPGGMRSAERDLRSLGRAKLPVAVCVPYSRRRRPTSGTSRAHGSARAPAGSGPSDDIRNCRDGAATPRRSSGTTLLRREALQVPRCQAVPHRRLGRRAASCRRRIDSGSPRPSHGQGVFLRSIQANVGEGGGGIDVPGSSCALSAPLQFELNTLLTPSHGPMVVRRERRPT